jgi:hypothetical protein
MRLLSQPPDSEVEFLVQLVQVPAYQVAHLDILQRWSRVCFSRRTGVSPYPLDQSQTPPIFAGSGLYRLDPPQIDGKVGPAEDG